MYNPNRCDSRTFLLYIDACEHGEPVGRYCNPCLAESGTFHGITQLIRQIDACLDVNDAPQAFCAIRRFAPSIAHWEHRSDPVGTHPGRLADFSLHILFRRHASWQGILTWRDQNKTHRFRSVLELINLIASALESTQLLDGNLRFDSPPGFLREVLEG